MLDKGTEIGHIAEISLQVALDRIEGYKRARRRHRLREELVVSEIS